MKFKFNWRKMGRKLVEIYIENLFVNEYDVAKKCFKKHGSEKTPFHASLFGNGLNQFYIDLVWNCPSEDHTIYGIYSCLTWTSFDETLLVKLSGMWKYIYLLTKVVCLRFGVILSSPKPQHLAHS